MKCPCHSQKDYEACCAPYHKGEHPLTALELMRSRYSAYALKNVDYIIQTTHPSHPDSLIPIEERKKQIENFCQNTEFTGLEILDFEEKKPESTVTFKAHLFQNGQDVSFIEKSAFSQINGKWLYVQALYLK